MYFHTVAGLRRRHLIERASATFPQLRTWLWTGEQHDVPPKSRTSLEDDPKDAGNIQDNTL